MLSGKEAWTGRGDESQGDRKGALALFEGWISLIPLIQWRGERRCQRGQEEIWPRNERRTTLALSGG